MRPRHPLLDLHLLTIGNVECSYRVLRTGSSVEEPWFNNRSPWKVDSIETAYRYIVSNKLKARRLARQRLVNSKLVPTVARLGPRFYHSANMVARDKFLV